MNQSENAEISYHPVDDEKGGIEGIQVAMAEAERLLSHHKGIKGLGKSKSPSGNDAIVVYVEDQEALSQLPATVNGFSVLGEVTGEIRAS